MARKSTPQPLTLPNPTIVDGDSNFNDDPTSPLSPKSPRSPRSPFRFNSSKRTQSELPSLQAAAELQQPRATLSSSQTTPSFLALQQNSGGTEQQQQQQKQEHPARGGFFSNYKATKSSSRLQNNADSTRQPEDRMSRDTDRPAMSGKVSSRDKSRTGTTMQVSTLQMKMTNMTCAQQSPVSTDLSLVERVAGHHVQTPLLIRTTATRNLNRLEMPTRRRISQSLSASCPGLGR